LFFGVPLLAVGVLVGTGRLHGHRKAPVPAGAGQPPKKDGWAQRALRDPRLGLAVPVGALCGTPGALHITALHDLVTGNSTSASQAVAVVIFVLIEFSLVSIPFAFLAFGPEGTKVQLKRAQDWLTTHARQLIARIWHA
jgi:ABC-type enterobactin transport system permease subunit